MKSEWKDRLAYWMLALSEDFYEPLTDIALECFFTEEMLTPEQAEARPFAPIRAAAKWGREWEYAWLRGDVTLDERYQDCRVVADLQTGGESTVWVNGRLFGMRRADWVSVPHHYLCDQFLTEHAAGGEQYHFLIEAYAGNDYPQTLPMTCSTGPLLPREPGKAAAGSQRKRLGPCTCGIWHEDAYQLWLDAQTLWLLSQSIPPGSLRAAQIEEGLRAFTLAVDFEQPRARRLADYRRARALLKPLLGCANGSTMPTFYAVGHAHLDLSWLWPYRETQRKVARTFAQQLRLLDAYPAYLYLQSQPHAYEICKAYYPQLYEDVRAKIRAGQWIAEGALYVEPDTNLPGGEALMRQIIYGKTFFQEEFGVDSVLLWLPDTFGYSAALPQMMRLCGVRFMSTQKILWNYNESAPFPKQYFHWQGIDGSRVVCFLHRDYGSRTDPEEIVTQWNTRLQQHGFRRFLLPFGYGDGGGGPTRDHIEYVRREQDLEGVPRTRFDTPNRFFEDCLCDEPPAETYVGELYFPCHRGTYTSQSEIKRLNRRAELALREAEFWRAILYDRLAYPADELRALWKQALLNQFHDILPGSSIAKVYTEARERYERVLERTQALTQEARKALVGGKTGYTAFNSLSWERSAVVRLADGYARAVIPACGMTSSFSAKADYPVSVRLAGGSARLENSLLLVTVNALGELTGVLDKTTGRERLSDAGNVLKLYKDVPRRFDAWDIDSNYALQPVPLSEDGELRIGCQSPFRASVVVRRTVGASEFTQEIALEENSARIDFITEIAWKERHRLLKACFPTGINAKNARHEIQYGYIERPSHRNTPYDGDQFEVCSHRWSALCNEEQGAAVLNDSRYGVSVLEDEIGLTLLRAPASPDADADTGTHAFTYCYYVWNGPFSQSHVIRQAHELNCPVTVAAGAAEERSFLSVSGESVLIDAVKAAEDRSGDLIVRMYESGNRQADCVLTVHLPFTGACEVTPLETNPVRLPVHDGEVSLSFRAFEIKTVRLYRL